MRRRYDWDRLHSVYLTGDDDLTPETLAARMELDPPTIARRAKAENWEFQRARYRDRLRLAQGTDIIEIYRCEFKSQIAQLLAELVSEVSSAHAASKPPGRRRTADEDAGNSRNR